MNKNNWEFYNNAPCELPEELASGVEKLFGVMEDIEYIPLLYIGKKNIKQNNAHIHSIICKSSIIGSTSIAEDIVLVQIYHNRIVVDAEKKIYDERYNIISIKPILGGKID